MSLLSSMESSEFQVQRPLNRAQAANLWRIEAAAGPSEAPFPVMSVTSCTARPFRNDHVSKAARWEAVRDLGSFKVLQLRQTNVQLG
jgi:hypothetical protein